MKLKSVVLVLWLGMVALIGAGIPIGEELRADCAFPPSGDAYLYTCELRPPWGCENECILEVCETGTQCFVNYFHWCTDTGCGWPACYEWGNCWAG